jgi:LuxR family maltose regulon positive regulatory protein
MHTPEHHSAYPGYHAVRLAPPQLRTPQFERSSMAQMRADRAAHRVTVISAAAGYGKTTLALQLTAADGLPRAWLTLDADDDDAVQLLMLLSAALARCLSFDAAPLISRVVDMRDPDTALQHLLQLLAAVEQPFVVVIDDLHLLTQPAPLRLLERLLLAGPPTMHWLLLSRHRLALNVSRLRLRGELREFNEADLRLDQHDIARFLQMQAAVPVDPALTALLARRTEGWIAGVRLAALHLPAQFHGGDLPLVQQHLQQTAGFLLDEVLRDLPPELEQVLLQVALVPQFNAELCALLTDRSNGFGLLRALVDRHLFVQRLDGAQEWYRLHQLLRDALLQRAAEQLSADHRAAIARRAADWFAHNGDLYHAAQLLLAVNADEAVEVVAAGAPSLLLEHRLYELERLLGVLPVDRQRADGRLLTAGCWLQFLLGDFTAFHDLLAVRQLRNRSAVPHDTDGAVLQLLADYTLMRHVDLAERAQAVLAEVPNDNAFARGWLQLITGLTVQAQPGSSSRARELIHAALHEFQCSAPAYAAVHVILVEAMLLQYAAHYDACLRFCREQSERLGLLPQQAVALDAQQHLLEFSSAVSYLRDELPAAADDARQWSRLAAQSGSSLMQLRSAVRLMLTTPVELQPADGRQLLTTVQQWLLNPATRERPVFEHLQLILDSLRLAVRCGAQDALRGIAAAGRLPCEHLPDEAPYLHWLAAAYVAAYSDNPAADWDDALLRQIERADRQRLPHLQSWLYALSALIAYRHGRHDTARLHLRRALALIERSRAVRIVLDLAALQPVLRKVDSRLSRQLLNRLQQPPQSGPALTFWERRVAERLITDMSAAAIAAEIGVTVSTVRFHLTRIYRKLGVARRAEAVARLRAVLPVGADLATRSDRPPTLP